MTMVKVVSIPRHRSSVSFEQPGRPRKEFSVLSWSGKETSPPASAEGPLNSLSALFSEDLRSETPQAIKDGIFDLSVVRVFET